MIVPTVGREAAADCSFHLRVSIHFFLHPSAVIALVFVLMKALLIPKLVEKEALIEIFTSEVCNK